MTRRHPIADAMPTQIYVEVTNRCNSNCRTCIRTFDTPEPLRDLSFREFAAIVDQLPVIERVVLHGIGEPLLNTEIADMIRYVRDRHHNAFTLFNSNAILLDEGRQRTLIEVGLDELRISIDSARAETYLTVRGIDAFDRVVGNVRHFAALARKTGRPQLSLWLTALRENLTELPDLVDLATELDVPKVYVQRLVLIDQGLASPEQSLYRRLREQEIEALRQATARAAERGVTLHASGLTSPEESLSGQREGHLPWSTCHRLWTTTYITANGNVLPCCISPFSTKHYASLTLGNVFETPLEQIWNGEGYIERRAKLFSEQPLHPCELCGRNWAL